MKLMIITAFALVGLTAKADVLPGTYVLQPDGEMSIVVTTATASSVTLNYVCNTTTPCMMSSEDAGDLTFTAGKFGKLEKDGSQNINVLHVDGNTITLEAIKVDSGKTYSSSIWKKR